VPFGISEEPKKPAPETTHSESTTFDPAIVSEALWAQWQRTVVEHGFGREKLGRLAPTLQALPTVIWHTPLSNYMNRTVAEIRQLKTHGEKRVRVVLEVFYLVHEMLSDRDSNHHLALRIVPKFIVPIENWLSQALASETLPSPDEVRQHLTTPLLDQIAIDAGPTIHELAASRLGIDGPPQSVRQQAKEMGVTRARVYQLLEECSRVMNVRWPEGQQLLAQLDARFQAEATGNDDPRMFRATYELFFPGKYKMADEELAASTAAAE
jgi:hypothetical protein